MFAARTSRGAPLAAAAELLATLSLVPSEEAARLRHTAGRVAAMLTGGGHWGDLMSRQGGPAMRRLG